MTVLSERHGAVMVVTLNRPERLNAISLGLLRDLHDQLDHANGDDAVRAIVLTGAGRAFCAGDDLKEFDDQARSEATAREHIEAIQQITRDLMLNGKPIVGAVHGFAVGGGFEWLLNCDLVVAADDLMAFFPELAIGQFVTGAVTFLLPQAVGHQRAMELLMLGERQSAARLLELGLVNRVVPPDRLLEEALAIATELASRNPFSVASLRRIVNLELQETLERALTLEAQATIEAFGRPQARAAAEAFGAPREPSGSVRPPQGRVLERTSTSPPFRSPIEAALTGYNPRIIRTVRVVEQSADAATVEIVTVEGVTDVVWCTLAEGIWYGERSSGS